jgi:diguanylate cyclase (GGDEF)-like protein
VPGPPRFWLLPGAPRWGLGLVALLALAIVAVGTVGGPWAIGAVPAPVELLVLAALQGGLLAVLNWRARTDPHERNVWRSLALGTAVVTAAAVLGLLLALIPGAGALASVPLTWAPIMAAPFWYRGVVRWNRYSTSLEDPNDILNGTSAVLALVAIVDTVLQLTGGPLSSAPWWETQPLVAWFGAAFVLVGTSISLPFIGALGKDPRTWLVVAAFGAGLAGVTATLLAGGDATPWAAATGPVAVVCLCLAAMLRPGRVTPQPADPRASTIGAFIVITASTAVLVISPALGAVGPAMWCAALAATGSSLRLLVNVRELSLLAVTRHEALTDELTGLANRRAVLRRAAELGTAGTPLALALLDLDKFKEVNDALGHAAGDELLRLVAERLRPALRPGDLLGRLGGDEFAVVAPMDPHSPIDDTAVRLATRLHERLVAPFSLGGLSLHSTVSIGVTTRDSGGEPDRSDAPTQLLREADVAMYDAKRSGIGIAVYDSSRHADSSGHLALVEELRTALVTDQLVLHHQPQLDVATGRTVGVEALVRWAHPVRGLLAPGDFLPLAEVHGLMGAVTEYVLARAVAQTADWRRSGLDLHVSVNLSASNLLDTSLPARVGELLAAHAVPADSIILEVTESVLLTDPERSLAVVGALAELGLTVSIDDYGTGYSSLAYLRDLPVRELKLDRSFTTDPLTDDRTRAIVASTIDLAHRLDLRVVAEGVEQEETLRHLASLGCDISQGYLHSRPLPADELRNWLTRSEAATATR